MGKFADLDDVQDRYEGEFPDDRDDWVELRIADVEADLILMVPSLEAAEAEIGSTRMARAKALVADKVLELFRNPERARTRTQGAGPYNESVTTYDSGKNSVRGYFTEDEVATLRLRSRRSNLGTARIKPFVPGSRPCW